MKKRLLISKKKNSIQSPLAKNFETDQYSPNWLLKRYIFTFVKCGILWQPILKCALNLRLICTKKVQIRVLNMVLILVLWYSLLNSSQLAPLLGAFPILFLKLWYFLFFHIKSGKKCQRGHVSVHFSLIHITFIYDPGFKKT